MYEIEKNSYPADTAERRESEVSRQMKYLSEEIREARSRTETLFQRLASVIAPSPKAPSTADKRSSPSTPFASNLADLTETVRQTNEQLSLILTGLEL